MDSSDRLFIPGTFSTIFTTTIPKRPQVSIYVLLFSCQSFFPVRFLGPFLFILLYLYCLRRVLFIYRIRPSKVFLVLRSGYSNNIFRSTYYNFSILHTTSRSSTLLLLLRLL